VTTPQATTDVDTTLDGEVVGPAAVNVDESGFVAVTPTVAAAWAGVMAVILVASTTTTLVAALPPMVIVAPLWKPVPLMVTDVPPIHRP
jgi:hypothetical protein